MGGVARRTTRGVGRDRVEPAELVRRVARRAGRRSRGALRTVRTVTRRASRRQRRMERLRGGGLLGVATRAFCMFSERAGMGLVAAAACGVSALRGRGFLRVTRRAGRVLRRSVGRAMARGAVGMSGPRLDALRLRGVAACARRSPIHGHGGERVGRVAGGARGLAARVEGAIVLRLGVARGAVSGGRRMRSSGRRRPVRRVTSDARARRSLLRVERRMFRRHLLVTAHARERRRGVGPMRVVAALAARVARHLRLGDHVNVCVAAAARGPRGARLVRRVARRARRVLRRVQGWALPGVARRAAVLRILRVGVRGMARRAHLASLVLDAGFAERRRRPRVGGEAGNGRVERVGAGVRLVWLTCV